jgi:hypothetical protein
VTGARAALVAAALVAAAPLCAQTMFEDVSARLPAKPTPGHAMNAKAADMTGDGIADLVIAMEREPNRLLVGDGRGGFTDGSDRLPRAARDSEETAIADFDRDGEPDIAVANEDDLLPELYLNDGRGRFTDASARIAHRIKANAVAAFDADRDGAPDLVFGGDKVSSLWMGDGRGGFRDESIARLPATYGGTQHVAVVDVDGDGDPDLVLGNEDRNQLYLNDGSGRFTLAPPDALPRPTAGPEETRDVEVADFDGDGRPDLFLANVRLWNPRAIQRNRLLLNAGGGRFTDASDRLPAIEENTLSALAIDLNGDGRIDLVTTAVGDLASADPAGPVRVLINMGGRFEEQTTRWLPPTARARGFDVTAIDIDRDGRMDLFVAGRAGPDLLLRRAR